MLTSGCFVNVRKYRTLKLIHYISNTSEQHYTNIGLYQMHINVFRHVHVLFVFFRVVYDSGVRFAVSPVTMQFVGGDVTFVRLQVVLLSSRRRRQRNSLAAGRRRSCRPRADRRRPARPCCARSSTVPGRRPVDGGRRRGRRASGRSARRRKRPSLPRTRRGTVCSDSVT